MALTGNKGEWSEIYVFLYLLGKGKLDVADENLNAVPGEFYKILEIIRKEAQSTNNYIREDETVDIHVTNDKTGEEEIFRFPIVDFVEKAKVLLERLKKTREKSHPEIENFLSQLKTGIVARSFFCLDRSNTSNHKVANVNSKQYRTLPSSKFRRYKHRHYCY